MTTSGRLAGIRIRPFCFSRLTNKPFSTEGLMVRLKQDGQWQTLRYYTERKVALKGATWGARRASAGRVRHCSASCPSRV